MDNIGGIENEVILHGRRNNQIWFAPTIGVIPDIGRNRYPEVVVSANQLVSNDIGPLHFMRTVDLGKTWTPPMESQNLFKIPLEGNIFETFGEAGGGLGLNYHRKTKKLVGIGNTGFVRDRGDETGFKSEEYIFGRKGTPAYSIWNSDKEDFELWKKVKLPKNLSRMGKVWIFGCGQSHECKDGNILLPCVHAKEGQSSRAGTIKCNFDGKNLIIKDSGKTVGTDISGGVAEPSIVEFDGSYFMTIRSESGDFRMYHAASKDGLNWEDFSPWCWDDGSEVETENTQQHWLKRDDSLYLVYTRKSELSNGVFRSRAPLWMAKVDTKTLRLIRESEVIVFPEKGARIGNFCVANITPDESWIVTGEWLEGMFPDKKKGMRFYVEHETINYIQYIGDLLLARVHWKH